MDFYKPISIFKNIWWYLFLHFIWGALASLYYNTHAFDSWEYFISGALFGFSISSTFVYGFILIWIEMDKKYSWIHQTGKRIFFGIFYGELYAILSFALVALVFGLAVSQGNIDVAFGTIWHGWKYPALNFIPSVLIVCVVAFFKNWSRSVVNQEKLQAEMMSYKFESLQNQLNPHFLFNSFNVLSNLVFDDKKLAIRFVDQLHDIYQYVLESKDKNTVSLSEEIAFIDAYSFLLKMRFEEKLVINVNVNPEAQCQVAPMVLQMLIENAVKHNVITKQNPLSIDIQLKDDHLIVSNNMSLKKTIEKSTRLGLINIKERYSLFTKQPVLVDQTNGVFQVSIPVLRKEVQYEN